mgnify:FL=1
MMHVVPHFLDIQISIYVLTIFNSTLLNLPMQVFPKLKDESWTSIMNYVIWKTMMPKYSVHNQIHYHFANDSLHAWKEMCHLQRGCHHDSKKMGIGNEI